jgi:cytoskeleton protein RodZ
VEAGADRPAQIEDWAKFQMAKITRLTLDQTGALDRRRLHLREEDADVPLETVGQDLRKARLKKGDDIAAIAAVLKIRKDHLQAVEESNFDQLPGRAYTIGFVRAYAQYLGLHAGECVERLKAEIAGRAEIKEPAVSATAPGERKLPPGGVLLAVFLVIALIYAGYYVVVAVGRTATPAVTPVPARLTELANPAEPLARHRPSTQISAPARQFAGDRL